MPEATPTQANPRADVNPQTVKPGVQTTEFWLTVAFIAISAGLAIAQIIPGDHAVIAAGILTVLYKALRAFVKVNLSANAARVELARIGDESGASGSIAEILVATKQVDGSFDSGVLKVRTAAPIEALPSKEKESETINQVRHGYTHWDILSWLVFAGIAIVLAIGLFSGCATNTGNAGKDRAGRVTNELLRGAALAIGQGTVTIIAHDVEQAVGGKDVDWSASLSQGLWAASKSVATSDEFRRLVDAYSGPQAETIKSTLEVPLAFAERPEEVRAIAVAAATGLDKAVVASTKP